MLTSCRNGDGDRRWIQSDFLKEKLRVRERYWHPISSEGSTGKTDVSVDESIDCIIPDALAWRMYLPLITYLVQREEGYYKQQTESSVQHRRKRRQRCCLWVVLESVTEWMDHRSVSSITTAGSVHRPPEMASPRERSKIQTLIQQHNNAVRVFCDLSFREGIAGDTNEDEWDLLRYEGMTMFERSQNALFRAGRLLRQYRTAKKTTSSAFFILSGDPSFVQSFPGEDGIQTILMKDLLEKLHRCFHRDHDDDESGGENLWLNRETLEDAKKIAIRCEEDYKLRNDPKRKSKSHLSALSTGVEEYWAEDRIKEVLPRV